MCGILRSVLRSFARVEGRGLFIHSWMKVKAMAERCEWTGVACCVAEVTA